MTSATSQGERLAEARLNPRAKAGSEAGGVHPLNQDGAGTRAGPVARQPTRSQRAFVRVNGTRTAPHPAPAVRPPPSPQAVLVQRMRATRRRVACIGWSLLPRPRVSANGLPRGAEGRL